MCSWLRDSQVEASWCRRLRTSEGSVCWRMSDLRTIFTATVPCVLDLVVGEGEEEMGEAERMVEKPP